MSKNMFTSRIHHVWLSNRYLIKEVDIVSAYKSIVYLTSI